MSFLWQGQHGAEVFICTHHVIQGSHYPNLHGNGIRGVALELISITVAYLSHLHSRDASSSLDALWCPLQLLFHRVDALACKASLLYGLHNPLCALGALLLCNGCGDLRITIADGPSVAKENLGCCCCCFQQVGTAKQAHADQVYLVEPVLGDFLSSFLVGCLWLHFSNGHSIIH
jgi:hypothetical protein